MPHALLVSLALAAAAASPAPAPAAPAAAPAASAPTIAPPTTPLGSDNLWLVAPLYPGQELLISRTEAAIHKLLPEGSVDLVGPAALEKLVTNHKGDLSCALGEKTCKNPIDDYMRSLGISHLVLIKGGQEEPNYVYQATAIDLTTGDVRTSSGTATGLEKALLAALVKVAPLASALKVASTPDGADVFIDGERVGKTPFQGQILPGERQLKLAFAGRKEKVINLQVPARGKVEVNENLDLSPSKLKIQPTPKDSLVSVDGEAKGQGDQEIDVTPGTHTVTVSKSEYEPFTQSVLVEPNKTAVVIGELQPTFESGLSKRSLYFYGGYEQQYLLQRGGAYRLNGYEVDRVSPGDNADIVAVAANGTQRTFRGGTFHFGLQRQFFGLEAIGLTFAINGGEKMKLYPGPPTFAFNDGTRSTVGSMRLLDLQLLQPHAHIFLGRFQLLAQAGFGLRLIQIVTDNFDDGVTHENGFIDFAPYFQLQGEARVYVIEGLYLSVQGRAAMPFLGESPNVGFTGGVGYAL
jgi:hypothetical protein